MIEVSPQKEARELRNAFEEEALHQASTLSPLRAFYVLLRRVQARDAAKFRAVGQRADYETFKNMARAEARCAALRRHSRHCWHVPAGGGGAPAAAAGAAHAHGRCARGHPL